MNNPFKASVIEVIKNCIRLGIWIAIVVNCFIFAVFSVFLTYSFFTYFARYLQREYFSAEWGVP